MWILLARGAWAAVPASAEPSHSAKGRVQVLILEPPLAQRELLPNLEARVAAELRLLGVDLRRVALPTSFSRAGAAEALRQHTREAHARLGVLMLRAADPEGPREVRTDARPASESVAQPQTRPHAQPKVESAAQPQTRPQAQPELRPDAQPHERPVAHVEILLLVGPRGRISRRRIPVPPEDPQATSLLALRVVEILRASVLHLPVRRNVGARAAPAQPDPVVPGGRPAHLSVPTRWGLRFGAGVSGSVGSVGPHLSLELALRWEPLAFLAVELAADAAPLGPGLVSADGDSVARVGYGALRLWLLWEVLRKGRWRPALGVGGGPLWFWTRGTVSPELIPRRDLVLVGDVAITAQLAVHLHRRLALRLGAQVGLAIPRLRVTFAHQRIASFGAPHLAGHLALETRF